MAMILVATETLLFTLGEYLRIMEMKTVATEYTNLAMESAFSEYNAYLWANYQILGIDLAYGSDTYGTAAFEERLLGRADYNANPDEGVRIGRVTTAGMTVDNYSFLTDSGGNPIVQQAVNAAGSSLVENGLDFITGMLENSSSVESVDIDSMVSSGKNSLDEAKRENAEKKKRADEDHDPKTSSRDYPDPTTVDDNPLDAFDKMKGMVDSGILTTVLGNNEVSQYKKTRDLPSERSLNEGNGSKTDVGTLDKTLYIKYLLENMSYYGNDLSHDGFQYEAEYLITGGATDEGNLATVVEKILVAREAANYAAILKEASLLSQVDAMAAFLAGWTANPAIVEAVKYALIGAWAYMESILDLRLILSGGQVALIKNASQWTSNLSNLSAFADTSVKAKDCGSGIGYKECLVTMLALNSTATLGLRQADVMEDALSTQVDYGSVRLDNMLSQSDVTINYEAKSLFLALFNTGHKLDGNYVISTQASLSY